MQTKPGSKENTKQDEVFALCAELYENKEKIAKNEEFLKQLKKDREEIKDKLIPLMQDKGYEQLVTDLAKFSVTEKEYVHFPSKDNIDARKNCVKYLSNLLGPEGLLSIVNISYSTITKLNFDNEQHIMKYWEDLKKKNPQIDIKGKKFIPGISKSFIKKDIRITKK